jgi:catechol 2,3-dioxygenase-like lactoylglutathione lyase family enzyme
LNYARRSIDRFVREGGTTRLAALVCVAALALATPIAARDAAAQVRAVDSVAVTVSEIDRSANFYCDVLGFQRVSDVEVSGDVWERLQGVSKPRIRIVRLRLGDEALELMEYHAPRGEPIPTDSRSNDRWFQHLAIVVSDMDRAYRRLNEHKVESISLAPQRLPDWNPAAGGIRAFYFRDPDEHPLEILQFPADKGDRKWQRVTDRLFLGIDHTAIVVSDTEKSLAFYRDTLGLRITGKSENYGPEQERLSNVVGAHLRITSLRSPSGPGVELLEYLAPGGSRQFPSDARANDLLHWQIRMVAANADGLLDRLRHNNSFVLSQGLVDLPRAPLGFSKGALFRDPDGHNVELVER